MSILVGKFFIQHMVDSYRTGVIEGEPHPGAYLVRFDWMKDASTVELRPRPPQAIIGIEMMARCCQSEDEFFEFFDSREELDIYLKWLDSPSLKKLTVVEVVKIH